MLYPKALPAHATVGITAPSCAVSERNRAGFEKSLETLKQNGIAPILTENVFGRGERIASSPATERAAQLHALLEDGRIDAIFAACGGDMLLEMLDEIDYEKVRANPKWIMGYSDVTGLILPITLKCDIATVYGPNAGGFDQTDLHPMLQSVFPLLRGRPQVQISSKMHERERIEGSDGYHLDTPTVWDAPRGGFTASGRMLSACIDCAAHLVGTPFAPVGAFIKKYESDGVIWNFDNFALSAEDLYYTLWNLKHAGWFENTRAVMISRTMFARSDYGLAYRDAALEALGDIPLVLDADTGHVKPQMPLVNGAMTKLTVKDGGGKVEQSFLK